MARGFIATDSEHLLTTSSPVTGVQLSISAWAFKTDATDGTHIVTITDASAGNQYFSLFMENTSGGNNILAVTRSGGSVNSQTTDSYSLNTWHQCGAVYSAINNRVAYLDGVAATANTTSRTPTGIDRIGIGVLAISSLPQPSHMTGRLAEVGIWSTALTTADMVSLSLGVSPILVRRDALVFYDPMIRGVDADGEGNSRDIVGGLTSTETGTITVEPHTRMYYPSAPIGFGVPAAAVAHAGRLVNSSRLRSKIHGGLVA